MDIFSNTQDLKADLASKKSTIDELIIQERWDEAYDHFLEHPDEAHRIIITTPQKGWTFLHWLCSMPETPLRLIDLVASLNRSAISMPDTRYGDTPLHLVSRSSQINCDKLTTLIRLCPAIDSSDSPTSGRASTTFPSILTRNVFGGTVLHSACHHNAMLEAIVILVRSNPSILKVRTHEGIHVVSALWMAYMQTIPGTMTVARFLAGRQQTIEANSTFERLWKKIEFISVEYYHYLNCIRHERDHGELVQPKVSQRELYVLHGLIRCDAPISLFKIALTINPNYALAVDNDGKLPLHVLVESRPYRLKEREAIESIIRAATHTAGLRSIEGELPLFIAIRNKIPWDNGLDLIVSATTCVVGQKDIKTKLYPFQYAAAQGGKVAIETTYQLLCTRPDLVSAYKQSS